MGGMSTKERIIKEASLLFAKKGYGAVGVEEIAEAVGIKAPSLYKHYKGKQEIFDAVMQEMKQRNDRSMTALQMDGHDGKADAALFENTTEDQLVQLGMDLFGFLLHDEYAGNFRKLLTTEQHRDGEMASLYTKQYVDYTAYYQSTLFALLSRAGALRHCNAQNVARRLYGALFLALAECECPPEREP